MKTVFKAITSPLRLIAGIAKPKVKVPGSQPVATRDDGRDSIVVNRDLLRRRGGAADVLFGSGGLEPGGASNLGNLGQYAPTQFGG